MYDLHHLNYRNLKKERFWLDLIPLYSALHQDFHQYAKANGLGNHQVLIWIDARGYPVLSEVRANLQKAIQYNEEIDKGLLPKRPRIKKQKPSETVVTNPKAKRSDIKNKSLNTRYRKAVKVVLDGGYKAFSVKVLHILSPLTPRLLTHFWTEGTTDEQRLDDLLGKPIDRMNLEDSLGKRFDWFKGQPLIQTQEIR